MKTKIIWIIPILLAILSMGTASAEVTSNGNVTSIRFVTNYTVGSNLYAKGGTTIWINATIGNITNFTAGSYNVTAKISNGATWLSTVTLANSSIPSVGGLSNWLGSYSTGTTSITGGAKANITINVTFFDTNDVAGAIRTNTSRYLTWGVDATNPSTATPTCGKTIATATGSCPSTQTVRQITGNNYYICWHSTDNLAVDVSNGTILFDFTSLPSNTTTTSRTGDLQSGGSATDSQFCYNLIFTTPGNHTFRVSSKDNVTNAYTDSTWYSISFGLPEEDVQIQTTAPIIIQPSTIQPSAPIQLPTYQSATGFLDYIISSIQGLFSQLFGWIKF